MLKLSLTEMIDSLASGLQQKSLLGSDMVNAIIKSNKRHDYLIRLMGSENAFPIFYF